MIIKVLLIVSVAAVVLFLMRGASSGRHLAVRRLATLVFAFSWVAAVLSPELVSRIANMIGVGRGTDLVLYLLVVAFVFTTVAQHRHAAELDTRVAALTRELAIHAATSSSSHARDGAHPAKRGE